MRPTHRRHRGLQPSGPKGARRAPSISSNRRRSGERRGGRRGDRRASARRTLGGAVSIDPWGVLNVAMDGVPRVANQADAESPAHVWRAAPETILDRRAVAERPPIRTRPFRHARELVPPLVVKRWEQPRAGSHLVPDRPAPRSGQFRQCRRAASRRIARFVPLAPDGGLLLRRWRMARHRHDHRRKSPVVGGVGGRLGQRTLLLESEDSGADGFGPVGGYSRPTAPNGTRTRSP